MATINLISPEDGETGVGTWSSPLQRLTVILTFDLSPTPTNPPAVNVGDITSWELYIDGDFVKSGNTSSQTRYSTAIFAGPFVTYSLQTSYTWKIGAIVRIDEQGGTETQFSETQSFTTGGPPSKAINPTPTDVADTVTLDQATITWEDGGGATSYDVYYGTSSGSLTRVSEGQVGLSFSLSVYTPYAYLDARYWRIDSINSTGTTTGDEWSWTTIPFDPVLPTGITLDGSGTGSGSPTGTVTGENNMATVRRLVAASNNKIWYESL
ncbi:hypothetical protein LCGC14_1480470 [marine sediment metagenome]|uniref:Fibronectin type-III domain-containing protein n=1 Tax=marine sediment metagenome TaxID=412755 RepID=A0A0F9JVM6_9ZZZZ